MDSVYWPPGSEPPPEFTFVLREISPFYTTRVYTKKHDGEQEYDWWFEPADDLSYDTEYKIELTAGDERVIAYFETESQVRSTAEFERPKVRPGVTEPLPEHVIRP